MIIIICLTGVLAGLSTMTSQSDSFYTTLDNLNWFVQAVFTLDVVIKIVAENVRPWLYFDDSWNNFDFFVVFVAYLSAFDLVQFNPIFFRLFRLFRVLKLLKKLKKLQVIINALTNCLLSVFIISVIIAIYLVIYASVGIALFRNNDPFQFGNYFMAILTLFQSTTYDNFGSVLYANLYGCEASPYPGLANWDK